MYYNILYIPWISFSQSMYIVYLPQHAKCIHIKPCVNNEVQTSQALNSWQDEPASGVDILDGGVTAPLMT